MFRLRSCFRHKTIVKFRPLIRKSQGRAEAKAFYYHMDAISGIKLPSKIVFNINREAYKRELRGQIPKKWLERD
jgi:hypothetical protein